MRRVSSIVEKDRKGKTRVEIAPSEEPRAPTVSLDEIEEDSYSDDDEESDFAGGAVDNRDVFSIKCHIFVLILI